MFNSQTCSFSRFLYPTKLLTSTLLFTLAKFFAVVILSMFLHLRFNPLTLHTRFPLKIGPESNHLFLQFYPCGSSHSTSHLDYCNSLFCLIPTSLVVQYTAYPLQRNLRKLVKCKPDHASSILRFL